MDFVQAIKAEHTRVTEVIDRLADTSDGALKTRERLVTQLGELLRPHVRKEEAYLYPALQGREAAQGFLEGALPAHQEMERLLAEIEAAPKDEEGFVPRVRELRRAVVGHAREEERLLPGLRRDLDADAARALDEAMAGEATVETAAVSLGTAALDAAPVGQARRTVQAAAEILGETAQLGAEDLQAITACASIAAGGLNEMRDAWMTWFNRTLRASARASQQVLRCSSVDQVVAVQRDFFDESMASFLESGAEMLRISSHVAESARRPIASRVAEPTRRGEAQAGR